MISDLLWLLLLLLGRGPRPPPLAPGAAPPGLPPGAAPDVQARAIRALQTALAQRGFSPGPIDGVLGPQTQAAIRAAEAAYGLPVTGQPSVALAQRLAAGAPVQLAPPAVPPVVIPPPPVAPPAPPPAPPPPAGVPPPAVIIPPAAPTRPTLRRGSTGASVGALRTRLAALGYNVPAGGNEFGPQTEAAVRAFQARAGLTVDGIVGPQTWAALDAPTAPRASAPAGAPPAPGGMVIAPPTTPTRPTLRRGSTGANVRALQSRLAALGYNIGAADGSFGPRTEAAVRTFQGRAGLTADGVVGPLTWAALDSPTAPRA